MPLDRTRLSTRKSRTILLFVCALGLASGSLARVAGRAAAAASQDKKVSPDGIWERLNGTTANRQTSSTRPHRLVEASVMEPDLAARFPEIKTYRGQGVDDPSTEVRCDWSPRGFHAMVAFSETTVTVHPLRWDDASTYVSYYSRDYQGAAEELRCQADQV